MYLLSFLVKSVEVSEGEKVSSGTEIILTYEKRDDLSYEVHYFYDGEEKEKAEVTNVIFGSVIPYDDSETKDYDEHHYVLDKVEKTGDGTVTTTPEKNIINVYYLLDDNGPDGTPDGIADAEEYHVTYQGNGGANKLGETSYKDPNIYPAAYTSVYASPGDMFTKTNAVFSHWKDAKTGKEIKADEEFVMPGEDVTLVAQWKSLSISKNYASKADNTAFGLGDTVPFTITVSNSGDTAVTNDVVVTDTLPGIVIDGGTGYTVAGDTATVSAAALAQGAVTINAHYVVTVDDIGGTGFINTATAVTTGDEEGVSVTATTDAIPMEGVNEQITMKKAVTNIDEATGTDANGNKAFALGDTVKFDIEVSNTGNQNLSDIVVEEQLAGATIVNGEGYTVRNNTAHISILNAGAADNTVVVKAEYVVKQSDLGNPNFRNIATATSGDTDGTLARS